MILLVSGEGSLAFIAENSVDCAVIIPKAGELRLYCSDNPVAILASRRIAIVVAIRRGTHQFITGQTYRLVVYQKNDEQKVDSGVFIGYAIVNGVRKTPTDGVAFSSGKGEMIDETAGKVYYLFKVPHTALLYRANTELADCLKCGDEVSETLAAPAAIRLIPEVLTCAVLVTNVRICFMAL